MKDYIVTVIWMNPYPKEFRYRENGSSFAVAVGKALRKFRSENKGRQVKQLNIKVLLP